MLERLWSGWRSTYVSSIPAPVAPGAGDGSVFTQLLNSGLPDNETYIVARGEHCFAILNAYPYASGHTLVLPYREVPDLELLTPEESAEVWAMTTRVVVAVKAAYQPGGVNVGINLGRPAGGSISQHLHVHIVPRWTGDANFMTAVANTRTLPETLDVSWEKVSTALATG
jgi:diadenosine tetraphosphate (Ap4A) HIT family hydrolase